MNDDRSGVLASAAWSAMVTASADPARFRRGRQYLRENAIVSLEVLPGQLVGEVQGSRAAAYEVVIAVPQLAGAAEASAVRLTPTVAELRFRCSCPDWESPCKHAVAVALAFGERLRFAPSELVRLRTGQPGQLDAPLPAPPSETAAPPPRRLTVVHTTGPVPPPPGPAELAPETVAFLGADDDFEPLELPELSPPTVPAAHLGAIDLGELIADAHSWLAQAWPR